MPKTLRLGIDLGGTKLEIVALDTEGRECLRRRVATPQEGYEATLAANAGQVCAALHELGLPPGAATIGVGTPGSISRATGLLRGSNSVNLNGHPIREDLARLLAECGKIAASDVESVVQRTCRRLREQYGKDVEPAVAQA